MGQLFLMLQFRLLEMKKKVVMMERDTHVILLCLLELDRKDCKQRTDEHKSHVLKVKGNMLLPVT